MPDRPRRARPTGQSMVSEDPAPTSIRDHGTGAGDLKLTPVRAGSHGIGKHWSSAGTSGHARQVRIAGHRRFTATTSDAGAALDRVRIPPDGCRGPAALANEAGVPDDGPHPAAKVVPSVPGPSHVHSPRPCPKHRSTAVIHGQQGFGGCSLRAVGSLHTERSEGASQARGRDLESTSDLRRVPEGLFSPMRRRLPPAAATVGRVR
jgi:hypothetical protein